MLRARGRELTGPGGPACAGGGQDAGGLVDGEVAARDGDVDDVGLGMDKAEIAGGDGTRKEDESFWVDVSVGRRYMGV